jgi:hypothetical protein
MSEENNTPQMSPSHRSTEKPSELTPDSIENPSTDVGGDVNPPSSEESKEALRKAITDIVYDIVLETFEGFQNEDQVTSLSGVGNLSKVAKKINKDRTDADKRAKDRAEAKTDKDGQPQLTPYSQKIDDALDDFVKSLKG